jgi:glyoxylase-like metal-dependent hydrolase (beta-lactamase superfamily II)
MKRAWIALSLALAVAGSAFAETPAKVSLIRIDCSTGNTAAVDVARFSDTNAFDGKQLPLTASCYLIRHGEQYLLWDTGYPQAGPNVPPGFAVKTPLVEQLAKLELKPEQITYVGISHYHGDHIGQARSFPAATLLIGKGDWEALTAPQQTPGTTAPNPALVAPWISGGGKLEQVMRDKDVFGDGSVMMLDLPGHTPGHHGLLVRLKNKGNVLLTGDLAHLRENYETNGVPSFNTNRADTLASLDRFKKMAESLKATVIIQHDPRDIEKLPAFPAAAD